jgi:trk system potassium uptake protein TrkH
LCRALVGVALAPALFATVAADWPFAWRAAAAAAALALLGYFSLRLPAVRRLQPNEAMVIVAVGYLVTALLMSWPLSADGLRAVDAIFHSMSAITTTGLATIASMEARSPSFLFTQAWMQWFGGLVVIVLAVLLIEPGPAARRLSDVDQAETDLAAGARQRARWALAIYSVLTLAGFVSMVALGSDWFDALVHALSGVSTGGFSSHDGSLAGLGSWPQQAAVILLALAGAIPLARYRTAAAGQARGLARVRAFFDAETRALLGLCLIVALLLVLATHLAGNAHWREAIWSSTLLAVSAQTTAGFTPVEVGALDHASKLILICAMFIGGGLGSTAGGIKVFRLLLVLKLLQLVVLRPALPAHAVVKTRVVDRAVDEAGLVQATGIVACFAAVTLVSWLVFVLYGYDALDALFEVVSATGTVGLSSGLASPSLEPALKLVLCADMWMGRLEIVAVLLLLQYRTWIGRRAGSP